MFFEGDVVPAAHFQGIEMVDGAKAVELVQAGGCPIVLEVRKAADVNNKLGATALRGQLEAGLFNIPVRQPQALTRLAKKLGVKSPCIGIGAWKPATLKVPSESQGTK